MSGFIAALPMYDWPELRAETDARWAAIRDRLRAAGIEAPEHLTRENTPSGELDLAALWRHPGLLLAQTCWGPMEMGLSAHVQVVGQPDYSDCEGGQGELYSSAVVMLGSRISDSGLPGTAAANGVKHPRSASLRSAPLPLPGGEETPAANLAPFLSPVERGRGGLQSKPEWGSSSTDASAVTPPDGRAVLPLGLLRGARFAFNSADSMSGFLAPGRDLEALGESLAIFSERIETGGHRASLRAVAAGKADVAAIDCRSWSLFRRFEPEASARLQVVGWTARRKGLPFVTARSTPPETVAALREALATVA